MPREACTYRTAGTWSVAPHMCALAHHGWLAAVQQVLACAARLAAGDGVGRGASSDACVGVHQLPGGWLGGWVGGGWWIQGGACVRLMGRVGGGGVGGGGEGG